MITLFRTNQVYGLDEIKDILATHIRSLPARISPVGMPFKILRYEFYCAPIDILPWLHNQHVPCKVYWSGRPEKEEETFEVGGIGVADVLQGQGDINYGEVFSYMEDRLSADNPHLRYYGGMQFDRPATDPHWAGLGSYRFIVPRFELLKAGPKRQTALAFNVAFQDIEREKIAAILGDLAALDFSAQTTYRSTPKVIGRYDYPDRQGWEEAFAKTKDKDGRFRYDKIVLARKSSFDLDVYINPSALLKHLRDKTPQCFHFCFQTDTTTAFLGASPERLYKRTGDQIVTEAVAGTISRGVNHGEDVALEQELLRSPKNALEHGYVVEGIRDTLKELCSSVRAQSKARLVKLGGGQHLVTQLQGKLHPKVSDDAIIGRLHPTPAVAGCPKEDVLRAIREIEPFDRGWYAGPVGYISYNTAEFAVAIRSALVNYDKLFLYAGAGIVEGSTPQGEWQEIETKIGNFIEVFNKE